MSSYSCLDLIELINEVCFSEFPVRLLVYFKNSKDSIIVAFMFDTTCSVNLSVNYLQDIPL